MAARRDRIDVVLPDLTPFDEPALSAEGSYDGVEFTGLDLSGQSAANARFLDCGVFGSRLDETGLRRARLGDCLWSEVQATMLDAAESSWRDVVLQDCRIGALSLSGAELVRVRISGGKYDYVNWRGATLSDVVLEGGRLGEVDLAQAEARDVRFVDCRIERLDVTGSQLHELDISAATVLRLDGIGSLSGLVISEAQLTDLAPVFAQQLGVRIAD